MYSVDCLNIHVTVFRVCGFWPNEDDGWLYNCWSTIFLIVVAIGFPLSQLSCVLFVDSVDETVEHLVLSSTVVMVTIKGFNVLIQKRKMVQLFNTLNAMDENVVINQEKYREIFGNVSKNCRLLNQTFFGAYIMSWSILSSQIIFSNVEDRGWSSTYLYPSAYLRQPTIYWSGLIYQALSNLIIVILAAAVDTYAVILLNILNGHIEVFKVQLGEFPVAGGLKNDSKNIQALVHFCENYKGLLRYERGYY